MKKNDTRIIPIASGKGGVGKTMFAANLSIALAERGHKTVVVDLDLGGSNLYTYLGLQNNYSGIGDYLKSGEKNFSELIVKTTIPNLSYLPGDGRTPFMANIPFDQRVKLTKEIRHIPADYIILDLAAGSHFNTLSFFGITHKGILITSIEIASMINCMMFLKNFMFRFISNITGKNSTIMDMLMTEFYRPMESKPATVASLIQKIAGIDKTLASKIQKSCQYFVPRIIINMGDHPDELAVLNKIDRTIQKAFAIKPEYFGYIFHDEAVRQAGKKREVVLKRYPDSMAAKSIRHIAGRIDTLWDDAIVNSQKSLFEDTQRTYASWMQQVS